MVEPQGVEHGELIIGQYEMRLARAKGTTVEKSTLTE